MSNVNGAPRSCDRIDRIGTIASSVCVAHCAVCALLPAAFGALGLGIILGHEAEWVFTLIAIAFAVGALVLGWRRHRSIPVMLLLVLGIAGLLTSRGLELGSSHHDHHGEAVHGDVHAHQAPAAEPADHGNGREVESHAAGSLPAEVSHFLGAGVGVLAGLMLAGGHLLNLRASRLTP